jgi:hypothetical protein
MKTIYATVALLAMGVLSAGPSLAAPAGSAAHRVTSQNLAAPVATFDCRRDERGWHYLRGERRVTCRPARPTEGGAHLWGWRCEGPRCGWWHQNERRWHDHG